MCVNVCVFVCRCVSDTRLEGILSQGLYFRGIIDRVTAGAKKSLGRPTEIVLPFFSPYYDDRGVGTALLQQVELLAVEGERVEEARKKSLAEYPSCNSAWSQSSGGEVWCSEKSGGIERDWVGLPRILTVKEGGKESKRCVCVAPGADQSRSDMAPYPGCEPTALRCRIPDAK